MKSRLLQLIAELDTRPMSIHTLPIDIDTGHLWQLTRVTRNSLPALAPVPVLLVADADGAAGGYELASVSTSYMYLPWNIARSMDNAIAHGPRICNKIQHGLPPAAIPMLSHGAWTVVPLYANCLLRCASPPLRIGEPIAHRTLTGSRVTEKMCDRYPIKTRRCPMVGGG